MSEIYIKQLLLGPMANFVYLIGSRSKGECLVVDPAWDVNAVVEAAEKDGMKIKGALVTHYHPDHIGGHLWGHDIEGVAELVGKLSVPIYVNKHEADGVQLVTGISKSDLKCLEGGDKVTVGDIDITTIHTPGHTPGSQCFLVNDNLVSGDTLFITGCGRVDLPGGNVDQLYDSLVNKIAKLKGSTTIYPGHNYDNLGHTSMDDVKRRNPYMQVSSLEVWRKMRL